MKHIIHDFLEFVDKFIWRYTERDEKRMIHELIEDSTGEKAYKESDKKFDTAAGPKGR